jgi:hypothetical protein
MKNLLHLLFLVATIGTLYSAEVNAPSIPDLDVSLKSMNLDGAEKLCYVITNSSKHDEYVLNLEALKSVRWNYLIDFIDKDENSEIFDGSAPVVGGCDGRKAEISSLIEKLSKHDLVLYLKPQSEIILPINIESIIKTIPEVLPKRIVKFEVKGRIGNLFLARKVEGKLVTDKELYEAKWLTNWFDVAPFLGSK